MAFHNKISSVWGESFDKTNPLPEYPRPDLVRHEWQNLNGPWAFAITKAAKANGQIDGASCAPICSPKDEKIPSSFDMEIVVPYAPECACSGLEKSIGVDDVIWYNKKITVPESWKNKTVLLHFDAVDYLSAIFIDGNCVCEHRGGYIPFTVEVKGKSTFDLVVACRDPSDSGMQQRGKQMAKPYGIYYTPTSGIWQNVWMEAVSQTNYVSSISYKPSGAKEVYNEIELIVEAQKRADYKLHIVTENGEEVFSGKTGCPLSVSLKNAHLWNIDDPFLYQCRVELYENAELVDTVDSYIAFRKIEVSQIPGKANSKIKDFILINGKAVFLNSPLDQGYWPESGLTPPSDKALLFDIESMKKLGFNGLRKHIKIESHRFYYYCDKLGVLVLQDSVSGGKNRAGTIRTGLAMLFGIGAEDCSMASFKQAGRYSAENRAEFEKDLADMVSLLGSHPSVIGWTIFNESWGQFEAKRVSENFRKLDNTRLVDSVSGWYDQKLGDFRSRHIYFRNPTKAPKYDKRPFFVSEFGGYNLAVPGHMWNENERFGYKFYTDKESLSSGYGKLMGSVMPSLIESGLRGAVYTQVSDVEIESNGLYTYDRKVLKIDEQTIKKSNEAIYKAFDDYIKSI